MKIGLLVMAAASAAGFALFKSQYAKTAKNKRFQHNFDDSDLMDNDIIDEEDVYGKVKNSYSNNNAFSNSSDDVKTAS